MFKISLSSTYRFLRPLLIWIGVASNISLGALMFLFVTAYSHVVSSADPVDMIANGIEDPLLRLAFLFSLYSWVVAPWFRTVEILTMWSLWRNPVLKRGSRIGWTLVILLSSLAYLGGVIAATYLAWSWSKQDRRLALSSLAAFFGFATFLLATFYIEPTSTDVMPWLLSGSAVLLIPTVLFLRRYMFVMKRDSSQVSKTSTGLTESPQLAMESKNADAQPLRIERLEERDTTLDGESIWLKQKELDSNH